MLMSAAVVLVVVVAWSAVAHRIERWGLTLPMALILAGVLVGRDTSFDLVERVAAPSMERGLEIVLAVLLFLDATEVGRISRRDVWVLVRLVVIGVPLSLLCAGATAAWLYPTLPLAACFVLACVVVPTDMAPAAAMVKDRRLSQRVRDLLNVESGYNDGIVAPLFLVGVALLGGHANDMSEGSHILGDMLPAAGWAVAVGLVVGAVAAWLARTGARREWTTVWWQAMGTLATPLLAYTLALELGGNGFVAAFVAGLAHRAILGEEEHATLQLSEHLTGFAQVIIWFVFGQVLDEALEHGIDWRAGALALLAITVVRIIPVLLALLGSSLSWGDRMLVAWLGPRGIASIVFALLALPHLPGDQGRLLMQVLGLTVVLSVVLHPVSAGLLARRAAQRANPADRGITAAHDHENHATGHTAAGQ